jgi:hypothetical protein
MRDDESLRKHCSGLFTPALRGFPPKRHILSAAGVCSAPVVIKARSDSFAVCDVSRAQRSVTVGKVVSEPDD